MILEPHYSCAATYRNHVAVVNNSELAKNMCSNTINIEDGNILHRCTCIVLLPCVYIWCVNHAVCTQINVDFVSWIVCVCFRKLLVVL